MNSYNDLNKSQLIKEIERLNLIIDDLENIYGSKEIDEEIIEEEEESITITIDLDGTSSIWTDNQDPKWVETCYDEDGSEIEPWENTKGVYKWLDGCQAHYHRRFNSLADLENELLYYMFYGDEEISKYKGSKILFGEDRKKTGENAKWVFILSELANNIVTRKKS